MIKPVILISFVAFLWLSALCGCDTAKPKISSNGNFRADKLPLADIIGTTHVNGRYYHTKKDYLNEGADDVLAMGSRVIKVWFYGKRHEHPQSVYSFNSDWKKVDNLVEGAKLPYWKNFFAKPFTTYILCVTSLGRKDDYWLDGITQEDARDETRQFYELTKHFLTTYQGTGKTFVLQHWEGDWMTRMRHKNCFDENVDPKQEVFDNMIKWLNARQAGVNQARAEFGQNNVRVYHAAEVNRVVTSMLKGKPNMVNKVIPFTNVDLVSYSSYDSIFSVIENKGNLLAPAIDFIKKNLPPTAVFGDNSVYLGEFGIPENNFSKEQIEKVLTNSVQTALDKNCPYIIYWQLYCNEPKPGAKLPSWNNNDYRGFWLIRADGTKCWIYDYLSRLCKSN
ncbi:MAG: hypothetical protein JXD22_09595 [Sedimentisphaerales bacterium]|nr:hypothetical protein [Sedimentisphaerales bacterium]